MTEILKMRDHETWCFCIRNPYILKNCIYIHIFSRIPVQPCAPISDQSQYLPPVDVTVPPPAMGDNSLFNPQLPDAIPFAPPMKTPTTPIELISAPNNSAAAADNLQKATADFETNNIAK